MVIAIQSYFRQLEKQWFVAPALLCFLDIILTLAGQSNRYWSGQYQEISEISPAFSMYLSIHPLLFVAAGFFWIGVFSILVATLPVKIGRVVSVAVSIGHGIGVASWIIKWSRERIIGSTVISESSKAPWVYPGFLLMIVVAAFVYVNWTMRSSSLPASHGDRKEIRWCLIFALSLFPLWWFVVANWF